MVAISVLFLLFTFGGPYMPEVLQHKGASVVRLLTHQWLETEGVFGIALGVSTSFVFLFVLFGTLLDKVGGGNWMMQISIAPTWRFARRTRQGRGGLVGAQRPGFGLFGFQRGVGWHLHHPADEAQRPVRR